MPFSSLQHLAISRELQSVVFVLLQAPSYFAEALPVAHCRAVPCRPLLCSVTGDKHDVLHRGLVETITSPRLQIPNPASRSQMTRVQSNMVGSAFPSPEDITLQEFRDALAKYDRLIEAVSASKGGKKISGSFSTPT